MNLSHLVSVVASDARHWDIFARIVLSSGKPQDANKSAKANLVEATGTSVKPKDSASYQAREFDREPVGAAVGR